MFFELKGDERITKRCSTEGCFGQPTWRFEAGGVGSYCCSGCKAAIEDDLLNEPPPPREPVNIDDDLHRILNEALRASVKKVSGHAP